MDISLDSTKDGLRNRFKSSKENDNGYQDEFEFEAPSLISTEKLNDDFANIENESGNLVDSSSDNNEDDLKKVNNKSSKKNRQVNPSATEFGKESNFRFNFQMPKMVNTPDKVDETSQNFLDTVHTPSKRLQSENLDTNKHKKARVEEGNYEPNWTFFKVTFGLLNIQILTVQEMKNIKFA
ncbi:hypothetical protein RND71_044243 [Anisodus tanguticus]|uniref:Uncharacterized protein n=1 Tax=Anisodus tanguticus TaxID=243964 RepID=A0AAE1QR12_9SOLA|nr:hypothetical protein RND71_044243 [Anisodus tanguticus]